MSTVTDDRGDGRTFVVQPEDLLGQTVLIIGGSSGIGLALARSAKAAGARLIITDRHAGRLEETADELGVEATAAFDETDVDQLNAYLAGLPMRVDHLVLDLRTQCCAELAYVQARQVFEHLVLPVIIAGFAAAQLLAAASLVLVIETAATERGVELTIPVISAACLPVMIANLALESAPVRVNLVTSPLAGGILTPDGVAALATHLMVNTALTGGTYDLSSACL